MVTPQDSIPLQSMVTVVAVLLLIGTLLVLPLYSFNFRKLVKAPLFTKIVLWIPIFIVFVAYLYLPNLGRLLILLIILAAAGTEAWAQYRKKRLDIIAAYYFIFAAGALLFFELPLTFSLQGIPILITLCFGSVMSDVMAYFFGNYLGKHKLPAFLNANKSWEGVAGQFVGAAVGVALVNWFIVPIDTPLIFLAIGLGSAIGDLVNSYVKRRLDIKDWSNNIPGHGGYLDRFASLFGAAALAYFYLLIT